MNIYSYLKKQANRQISDYAGFLGSVFNLLHARQAQCMKDSQILFSDPGFRKLLQYK